MFNPVKASENIKNEFIDYISTVFSFSDYDLQAQLVDELNSIISKGPYLELNDVFRSGKSIEELIEEGVLSRLFRDLEAGKPDTPLYKKCLPIKRPLYLHQEKAIRSIVSGRNVVISTGTGSGKTNCFLIPVINELLLEQERGTLGPGVRAMFIYPMNALANDQMKNIRKILMHYPSITFGVYNGGTENEEERAIAVYESMFSKEEIPELKDRLRNEILSRDAMKKTPPNILFTNYAMLEHLLFRPNDDVLFSKANFRFVVLDEAHVYTGATGIETSLLLRRLKARVCNPEGTQFILTSATLGSDSSYDEDILAFANNLCGEEFTKDCIIRSSRESYSPNGNEIHYPSTLYQVLADESNIASKIMKDNGLDVDSSKPEAELLYDFIASSNLYARMRSSISGITDMSTLSEKLGVDLDTAIAFISLCTRANKNGKSLVDARYHYFVRSLEGCFLAFTPQRKLFLTRRKQYLFDDSNYEVFEIATCEACGEFAIVGKLEGGRLVQSSKLNQEVCYFYPSVQMNDDIEDDEQEAENQTTIPNKTEYGLCIHCGMMYPKDYGVPDKCNCGSSDFLYVTMANPLASGARCGNCHTGAYKRFYLGNEAATAVLATSLYEELPEIEYKSEVPVIAKKNIFAKAVYTQKKESKRSGRQFLVFSDSRQEAAKFACYLGKSYDEFLRRRGICQIAKNERRNLISNVHTISDFVSLLTNYFTTKKSFSKSNFDDSNLTTASRKNAWVAMLNELARFRVPTSLTSLGILQFSYMGNSKDIVEAIANEYNVDVENVQNLLDLLVFEIIKVGAIRSDTDSDIDDNDREYIFFSPSQRFIKKNKDSESKPSITGWMPKCKLGKKDEYCKNNKIYYVTKILKISQKEAAEFLEQYFEFLTDPANGNRYCMEDPNKDGTYVMPAKYFQVRVPGCYGAKWYRCEKCGRVSQFNISGHCSTVRCEGAVVEINPEDVGKENHFAKLYFSDRMSPLFIKEHTAQLSKKEGAEYQEQFVKKEINALSCSTTFEMGVDVGDLETVFLRNVPPLPSNYAQRAGRAGRSVEAAAYALTFAKLSSHDLSFYKNPEKMIKGTILPPLFKVDNEKIVRRHVYDVALSMFFAANPDEYNHNDAEKFINEKGYQKFISWLQEKPEELMSMLKKSIPDIDGLHKRLGFDDFSWLQDFIGEDGVFTQLIIEYESNVANFNKLITSLKKDSIEQAGWCERKRDNYMKNKLIEFLARGNILPRYGFPVDTVELEQNTTAKNINKLRLSRDLQIAIAEYAPSSEVIADGRLYTSRYIKKAQIGKNRQDWHTAYIAKCTNEACNTMNYSLTPIPKEGVPCISCGSRLKPMDFFESIEPKNGFVTERKDRDVPMTKQEKNYKSEDFYIGNRAAKTIEKYYYRIGSVYVKVESTTNDSLMVKSSTNFYVCPICGYAIAEDESVGDAKTEKSMRSPFSSLSIDAPKYHESLYGTNFCKNRKLNRRSLHHVFNTDVAKISFSCDTSDLNTMISSMYAILYSISQELNIERKDIKACLSLAIDNSKKYSIIIYDAVPGGAGHSRRLVTEDGRLLSTIFKAAQRRVEVCNCEPSCYNCLRSYENQRIHDILDRKLVAEFLRPLTDSIVSISEEEAEPFFKR